MENLVAARLGMAASLAFHILFAMAGMSLPVLIVVAELRALRSEDPDAAELARRWTKGLAVLFAVGAVSGTVLSFELGLLWPTFMEWAGPAIGFLFAMEGFAFFLEAIFLGIYLYGRDRIPPPARLLAGFGIAVTGNLSALFVVLVNAWMNHPVGVRYEDARLVEVDPWAILTHPAGWAQAAHMVLAASAAIPFLVAGIHARELARAPGHSLHRLALESALIAGILPALLLPASGHLLATGVAVRQPAKLAAMEAHWRTGPRAPLILGGLPDEVVGENRYALEIPGGLSWLAFGDPEAVVLGLDAFAPEDRPPVLPTHLAFQVMVGCGTVMVLVALVALDRLRRGGSALEEPWFLRLVVLTAPLGVVATEAGWIVTEVGRQPWVIAGLLRTADAATRIDTPWLAARLAGFGLVYLVLGSTVIRFLAAYLRQVRDDRGVRGGP